MSDYHHPSDGESDPQHGITVVFLLVLVFFIMGLVGLLICHVLKKKGYRCRTFRDELDPDDKDGVEELQDGECWGMGTQWGLPFLPGVGWCSSSTSLGCGMGLGGLPVMCGWAGKKGWGGEGSTAFPGDQECEGPGIPPINELTTAGGDREVGSSAWSFGKPKECYHQKVLLMNIQDF